MQAYFESQRDTDSLFHIERKVNDRCPAHFHSNIELLYVLEGEIEVAVNQHRQRLPAGSLSAANSFDVHAYHTGRSSRTLFLIIPAETVDFYHRQTQGKRFETPFLYSGPHSRELESSLGFLEKYDRTQVSPVSLGHICVVLGILLDRLRLVPDEIAGTGHLIRSILLYLDQHYLEPVTIGELAGVFGYNRSYLSRVFNAYVRTGFHPYVNRLRVRHAARLIQTTEAGMGQIAEASGFASVRSFNRAFAELYQITPMAYRKHRQAPTDQGREIDRLSQVFSYLPPEKQSPAAPPLSARK